MELGERVNEVPSQWQQRNRQAGDTLSETFALFGGGRAVSENLQLDRALLTRAATQPEQTSAKLSTITGITVREMDWKPLIEGKSPTLDALAGKIPGDQHAIFFPSFQAAVDLVDEAQRRGRGSGAILLIAGEEQCEDAQTQERYERQLCLPLSGLGRLLGPALVKSLVATGSDPYLRTGSDLAVIFQATNAQALEGALAGQVALAAQTNPAAKVANGTVENVKYTGLVAPDRSVCTYRATVGESIVVTNSLAQLRKIVTVQNGKSTAISAAPEYIFFRDRYKLGDADETAFVVLTDATIRRWCSPQWRIADSRRTRAAAILSEMHARSAAGIINGAMDEKAMQSEYMLPDLGDLRIDASGATSSTYGRLRFLTPIAELEFDSITEAEAGAYRIWRNRYQNYWRAYFDPIAARLTVVKGKVAADLTVMPLIFGTDYRQFIDVTNGSRLAPMSGDPHDAIGQLAVAINPESRGVKSFGSLFQTMSGNLKIDPFAWLGNCAALYADEGPFWKEASQAKDEQKFLEENFWRAPIALYVESKSAMKLAAFLTMLRGFADQAAPGLTTWETLNYDGQPYAKVSAHEQGGHDGFAIYYAAMPQALVVSLDETVLQHAIVRQRQRGATTQSTTRATTVASRASTQPARAWLGDNLALRLENKMVRVLANAAREEVTDQLQVQAFANIPILNEWKRLFPNQDPVQVHEKLFAVRLVDPAGGSYVWNEKWQTMESANFGHPGEPKMNAAPLADIENQRAEFGLTFENQGVRARAQVEDAGK